MIPLRPDNLEHNHEGTAQAPTAGLMDGYAENINISFGERSKPQWKQRATQVLQIVYERGKDRELTLFS